MSDRKMTPFTNEHFAAFCEQMVGQPYWFGTCGYKATTSLLKRKTEQYPSHYGSSRTSQYKQDIANRAVVCDCIGAAKGYAWTDGGQTMLDSIGEEGTIDNKYGTNNCPDKGANSMFSYAKSKGCAWGGITTLPEIVGLALHKEGHVCFYIGNGYAVEWRNFDSGCVKTKVAERDWLYWYELPFLDYGNGKELSAPTVLDVSLGSRLLQKGMEGEDVRTLQEHLMELGYSLTRYGADGDFGNETEKALKRFQKDEGLDQDGKYGDRTHSALMDALADAETEQEEQPVATARSSVVIVSDGGKVNIRCGNSTSYARITSALPGSTFAHIATAQNGWHAIECCGKVGWVSGEYARFI